MRRRLTASALVLAASTVVLGVSAGPASAADTPCVDADTSIIPEDTTRPSAALALLGIVEAQDVVQRFAPAQTDPVGVAVLGSGVKQPPNDGIPVIGEHSEVGEGEKVDGNATIVAGLVAAAARDQERRDPIGVAPDARIVDVRVYVDGRSGAGPDEVPPSAAKLAAGLDWVADHQREFNIRVATVGFTTGPSDELAKAVERVRSAGVVVVAASGDRPQDEGEADAIADPEGRGEDGAKAFYPAGYPGVVAVNSTSDGSGEAATTYVARNSKTLVAAPTYGAVSYGLNGASCVVSPISTAAAAGEVGGVVALLWQRYPTDSAKQIVARLVNTATGTPDDPTPLVGAGVVQPYAALTRPLAPAEDGTVEQTVTQVDAQVKATAPERESDLLVRTRENAVWWGLIGGGVLVVALLLRPVLARRR